MANVIDSLNFDGTTEGIFTLPYGTCATVAATVAKVATATNFVLETGARIAIKFTYANSAASPTLNVNSSGAKAIYWHGAALASDQYWQAGAVLDFVYNGTQWELIGIAKDNNTTYSAAGSALGLVKTGGDVTISDGVITVTNDSHTHDGRYYTETEIDNKVSTINTAIDGKAASSHTHNYAGSSSAGGAATSANKINTNAGSATQPVYFSNGIPVKTTYTLGKSVPSDAKFTDTTYSVATTSANGLMSSTDKQTLDNLDTLVGDTAVAAQISNAVSAKAPTNHASTATTYGIGTGSNYGHVKLSDSVTSTSAASAGIAASPKAVKTVNDKIPTYTNGTATRNTTNTSSGTVTWYKYGRVVQVNFEVGLNRTVVNANTWKEYNIASGLPAPVASTKRQPANIETDPQNAGSVRVTSGGILAFLRHDTELPHGSDGAPDISGVITYISAQ